MGLEERGQREDPIQATLPHTKMLFQHLQLRNTSFGRRSVSHLHSPEALHSHKIMAQG